MGSEDRIIWRANLHPTRAPCKGRETKGQNDTINKVQEKEKAREQTTKCYNEEREHDDKIKEGHWIGEPKNERTNDQRTNTREQGDKIIKSSAGGFSPRTFPLREQDNKNIEDEDK